MSRVKLLIPSMVQLAVVQRYKNMQDVVLLLLIG